MTEAELQAPATKLDIALLMEEVTRMNRKTEKSHRELREQERKWEKRMNKRYKKELVLWEKKITHELHVVGENIRHDYEGALNDLLSTYSDEFKDYRARIVKLEQRVGIF